ncbi:hypothetical protein ACFHW2_12160 [Actinomadura sp. LOL_016]|uniref:hypothetical protein n=1 Tax=unclassified Actinomadura TaxID=2626254 RepID=UPI003A80D925
MIALQFSEPVDPARLVEACLIAAGVAQAPVGSLAQEEFLALANQIGDGLDQLPMPVRDG